MAISISILLNTTTTRRAVGNMSRTQDRSSRCLVTGDSIFAFIENSFVSSIPSSSYIFMCMYASLRVIVELKNYPVGNDWLCDARLALCFCTPKVTRGVTLGVCLPSVSCTADRVLVSWPRICSMVTCGTNDRDQPSPQWVTRGLGGHSRYLTLRWINSCANCNGVRLE